MNIAVSGASSFVGINIVEQLIIQYPEARIYALVRPNSLNNKKLIKLKNKICIVEIDMANMNALPTMIESLDVFYLNAWNGTRGNDRENEELQRSNYKYTIEAINIAIGLGANTIIGVGSQAEYGIVEDEIEENHPTKPVSAYGKYKLKVFKDGLKICLKNNVNFKWGRIFSAYGADDNPNTLISYCVKNMLENKPINVSQSTQMWNYINIKDVAYFFAGMLSDCIPSGPYNISSDDTRVLKDYILEIKNTLESNSLINYGAIQNNIRLMNLIPNNSKLLKYFANYRFIPFSVGIREIVNKN